MNKNYSSVLLAVVIVALMFAILLQQGFSQKHSVSGLAAARVECNDGKDNDGDGLIDYQYDKKSKMNIGDPGCTSATDNDESNCGDRVCEGGETCATCPADCGTCTQCNDKIDNDKDGLIDYPADKGCSSLTDNDESNCGNQICESFESCSSCPADCGKCVECDDGIDNDGDGYIDYPADKGCAGPTYMDESNCGDKVCEGTETCTSCVADCGICPPTCGDGKCEQMESCSTCPQDCHSCTGDGLQKYYFLLMNGEDSSYWPVITEFYNNLTQLYGIPRNQIIVVFNNGKDANLNKSGVPIDYPSTKDGVTAAFQRLRNTMDGDDTLFVRITGHGGGYTNIPSDRLYGYVDGVITTDPTHEQEYKERDFKLRSLYSSDATNTSNVGMGTWHVVYGWAPNGQKLSRVKYVSTFQNLELQNGSILSDNDIFIEQINDLTLGDYNKDGIIEPSLNETFDYNHNGQRAYNPTTKTFDDGDWGLPDSVVDNYNLLSTGTPLANARYCLFDNGFDNHVDVDFNCSCRSNLNLCNVSKLHVHATDLDNQGLFDGIDANMDGDFNDTLGVDEVAFLYTYKMTDDDLKAYLKPLNVGKIVVFLSTCNSGGFVDDLSDGRTIIMANGIEEKYTAGNDFDISFNALTMNPTIGDSNHDGKLSMAEVFNYCGLKDSISNTPQYDDNGDGISHTQPLPNGGDGVLGSQVFMPQKI